MWELSQTLTLRINSQNVGTLTSGRLPRMILLCKVNEGFTYFVPYPNLKSRNYYFRKAFHNSRRPELFDFKQLKSKNQSYTLNLLKTFLSIRSLKN